MRFILYAYNESGKKMKDYALENNIDRTTLSK